MLLLRFRPALVTTVNRVSSTVRRMGYVTSDLGVEPSDDMMDEQLRQATRTVFLRFMFEWNGHDAQKNPVEFRRFLRQFPAEVYPDPTTDDVIDQCFAHGDCENSWAEAFLYKHKPWWSWRWKYEIWWKRPRITKMHPLVLRHYYETIRALQCVRSKKAKIEVPK